jgi:6-pyruvoyltetrahydropterin/6-carboxytetrahydropterin synthase
MMYLTRKFHFYASHRNEELKNKCFTLHGHTYHIECHFLVARREPAAIGEPPSNVTVEFSDFDVITEPLRRTLCHSMLMHEGDPIWPRIRSIVEWLSEIGDPEFKVVVMPCATSLENLGWAIFHTISLSLFHLQFPCVLSKLVLKETETTQIIYEHADYKADMKVLPWAMKVPFTKYEPEVLPDDEDTDDTNDIPVHLE